MHLRDAPEFSKDCSLQPADLSQAPMELGAHIFLPALRTFPPYFPLAQILNPDSLDGVAQIPAARSGRRDHSPTDTVHHGTDNIPRRTLGHRGRKQLTSRFWGIGIDNASIRILGQRDRFCLIRESGQRDRSLFKSHIGASGSIMPQYAKRGIGTVFSSFANWVNGTDLYSSPLWVFGSRSSPIRLCDWSGSTRTSSGAGRFGKSLSMPTGSLNDKRASRVETIDRLSNMKNPGTRPGLREGHCDMWEPTELPGLPCEARKASVRV
jgi:hypothetical protein